MDEHRQMTNAFDAMRVAAALVVLYSHNFPLVGLVEPAIFGDSVGKLAVAAFFAISGCLVCESWSRDLYVSRFARRRGLRIWPALVAAVMFTTIVVGLLAATDEGSIGYFKNDATWAYLLSNVTLVAGVAHLSGVFERAPQTIVNGPMWTFRY